MALTATLATAACAVLAAAAIGLPPALLAALLIPGIALAIIRPHRPLPRVPGDPRVVIGVAAMGGLGLYAFARTPQHYRLFLLAVVPLSLLWPHLAGLRISLAVAGLSLPGVESSLSEVAPYLLGMLAAAAVALVTMNRPRFAHNTPADERRYIGTRSAILFAFAALIAFLVATLWPSPQSASPSAGENRRGSPGRPQAAPTYLQPTDRLDAGGPGTGDSDEVLFRVSARFSALWRTMTFDTYDGRSWFRSTEPYPFLGSARGFVPPGPGDSDVDYRRALDQRIEIRAPYAGVLPAAARLTFVRLPDGTQTRMFADGTVVPLPGLGRGGSYAASSIVVPSDPEELRGHDAAATGVPPAVAELYLDVPVVAQRVTELARQLTATSPGQYDKVAALERWLVTNTSVARKASALPPGTDPVDEFLFGDGTGASHQAATAMAVMLRSLGIPARVAVGFLPGNRAVAGDEFVVRGRHAHAWVEVWFPDVGWAAFDPSGFFEGPSSRDESLLERLKRLRWLLVIVLVAATVLLAVWAVRRARRRRARPWATRCYEQVTKAGGRRGRPRRPEETPAEYCSALAAEVPDERLARVGDLVTVAAWSEHEPSAEAKRWADGVVATIPRRRSRAARPG